MALRDPSVIAESEAGVEAQFPFKANKSRFRIRGATHAVAGGPMVQDNDCTPTIARDIDTVLRWMRENALAVSSIVAGAGQVELHSRVSFEGGTLRGDPTDWLLPNDRQWMVNSATCLIVCCYIDALGKTIVNSRKERNSSQFRFGRFFDEYVRVSDAQLKTEQCDQPVKGKRGATVGLISPAAKQIFTNYRLGFVHQFSMPGYAWGRCTERKLWIQNAELAVLNINYLVELFIDGLDRFTISLSSLEAKQAALSAMFE